MNFWELNEAAKHPLGEQYDIDHLTMRISPGCLEVFCTLFRIKSWQRILHVCCFAILEKMFTRLRIKMIMTDSITTEINMNMRISSSMNVSSNMHIDIHTIIKVSISNASTKYEQKY